MLIKAASLKMKSSEGLERRVRLFSFVSYRQGMGMKKGYREGNIKYLEIFETNIMCIRGEMHNL